jgi:hypothetical protein
MAQNNPAGEYRPQSLARSEQAALAPTGETAAMVLAAQAKALVSARYEIAIRQPRDLDDVRARLLRECQRPSFAEVAIYHKPIGKGVEGPSIRFAEAAIQAMRNLAIETPAIYDDAEKRILRVTVSDMETNVTHSKDVTIQKTVERRSVQSGDTVIRSRQGKDGHTVYIRIATDDEILNTENALVSKALRTTGLRLVPGWLIDECMTVVKEIRAKQDANDPDAAKRKLFDAFQAIGVSVDALKQWLQHDGSILQPKELEELRGIYTAIKDGDTTWAEVMDARWAETLERGAKQAERDSGPLSPGNDPPSMSSPKKGPAAVKAAIANGKPATGGGGKRPSEIPERVAALRAEIADRVGAKHAETAWMDAIRDCTGGRPSTHWNDEDISNVASYLANWKIPGAPPVEREPGSDDGDDEFAT